MQDAIEETNRRREKQLAFNEAHNITPQTIHKEIRRGIELELRARKTAQEVIAEAEEEFDVQQMITDMEKQMLEAAEALEFEKAAELRDRVKQLKDAPELATSGRFASRKIGRANAKPGAPGSKVIKKKKRRVN